MQILIEKSFESHQEFNANGKDEITQENKVEPRSSYSRRGNTSSDRAVLSCGFCAAVPDIIHTYFWSLSWSLAELLKPLEFPE